jgi:hypothetical protein
MKAFCNSKGQEVITYVQNELVLPQGCKVSCDLTYWMCSVNQSVTALQLKYIYPHCEPSSYSLLFKLFLSDTFLDQQATDYIILSDITMCYPTYLMKAICTRILSFFHLIPRIIQLQLSSQANPGEGTHHQLLDMIYTILIKPQWLPGSHYNPSETKSYMLTTITARMHVLLTFIKPKLYFR